MTRPARPRGAAAVSAVVLLTVLPGVVAFEAAAEPVPDGSVAAPVVWGPCERSALERVDVDEVPPAAQCGSLTVPVDYSRPDGATAALALIRFPATGDKIGSLVLNPGGPGMSGVASAAYHAAEMPAEVRERFDIVGFDPRGVGLSIPKVVCNSGPEKDAQRAVAFADFSPAGVERLESMEREFAARCLQRTGQEFLANVGTVNVVRDLDRLRAALGDAKLTYLGYSYGTFLGTLYAEAYPDKVRALVLDGAIDPTADPIQVRVDQAAAFQGAFDAYAADCAKDSDCPLGTDPAKAVDAYHDLVNPLVDQPAPTDDPRGLGYADALVATDGSLYYPDFWGDLTEGLRELAGGRGDILLELADFDMGRDESGQYNDWNDTMLAIRCVDTLRITDRARAVEQDRRLREVAPYESYGEFTGFAPLDWCAFWPVPPTNGPRRIVVPGLPPVLVVSTTGDPATPYQAGVTLAQDLGAALLTYNGVQHTIVFNGQECIDAHVTRYLVDLVPTPPGAAC